MAKDAKTILVVEGNHEGLVKKTSSGKPNGAAEQYGAVLKKLDRGVKIIITRPHFAIDPAAPVDWAEIDGVAFTGAGVNWAADASEAAPARRIMETAFQVIQSHQLGQKFFLRGGFNLSVTFPQFGWNKLEVKCSEDVSFRLCRNRAFASNVFLFF